MGFYHPSTLVKDAQRRGVRFHPIDVQVSDWDCTVEADGAIRLGLRYVSGLREQVGQGDRAAPAGVGRARSARRASTGRRATCRDLSRNAAATIQSMLEPVDASKLVLQQLLARLAPAPPARAARSASLDDLVARTGLRRDEVVTLADIGALNSFGYDRRSALWQAERAVRPVGRAVRRRDNRRARRARRDRF